MKQYFLLIFLIIFSTLIFAQRQTAEKYKEIGTQKAKDGDFVAALENLTKSIEIDPTYDKAFNNRGIVKLYTGKYYEAIEDFIKAIELNSNDAAYYLNRALAFVKLKYYKEALSDYSMAIQLDSDNAEFYKLRGHFQNENLKFKEAIEDYTKAIELDSSKAEYHYTLGMIKLSTSDYSDGHRDVQKAAELGYFKAKDMIADVFFKAIPDNEILTLSTRASTKFHMKDFSGAANEFGELIKKTPKNATAYYYRGLAMIHLENIKEGCADLKKSLKLGEKSANEEIIRYCK